MKKITLLASFLFAGTILFAQNQVLRCYTYEHAQEMMQKDPSLIQNYQNFENMMKQISENNPEVNKNSEAQMVPRVIPVVFHIIHEGGTENISTAQILDQLRVMNEDFQEQNADTVNAPAPFAAVRANCNIEFRMAQKDPNGNCTDGIVRVYSSLTNNANDYTKLVSTWPNTKYLNIWVVKTIESSTGIILGYAQFPGMGNAATDGIIVRHDCIGTIGTAPTGLFPTEMGRVPIHEVGHWLGLRHIWGDGVCLTDFVADTPPAQAENSGCPTFPHQPNICTGTGPNGEMFCNYMDYSNGNCINMFTVGQKGVMDAVLNGIRSNLIGPSNLFATGTNGTPPVPCAPIAAISPGAAKFICAGGSVAFSSTSYNGTPTSWIWSFPGGTPATSTTPNQTVVYSTPGVYGATLTVSNGVGTSTKTITSLVYVSSTTAMKNSWQYYEGFDVGGPIPNTDWWVINENNDSTWKQTTNGVYYSPNYCMMINNSTAIAGRIDQAVSPSIDFSNINTPTLYFKVAFAQRALTSVDDKLRVLVSTNCGATWVQRYSKTGATLATVTPQGTPFLPWNTTQWRTETVNIAPYANSTSVRIKFEFTSGGGNNIYIDDINVIGPLGETELEQQFNFIVFPNPTETSSLVLFDLNEKSNVNIKLYDMLGREVEMIASGELNSGNHQFIINETGKLEKGIYLLKMEVNGALITKKIIIN